jgi:hypothetical protein
MGGSSRSLRKRPGGPSQLPCPATRAGYPSRPGGSRAVPSLGSSIIKAASSKKSPATRPGRPEPRHQASRSGQAREVRPTVLASCSTFKNPPLSCLPVPVPVHTCRPSPHRLRPRRHRHPWELYSAIIQPHFQQFYEAEVEEGKSALRRSLAGYSEGLGLSVVGGATPGRDIGKRSEGRAGPRGGRSRSAGSSTLSSLPVSVTVAKGNFRTGIRVLATMHHEY